MKTDCLSYLTNNLSTRFTQNTGCKILQQFIQSNLSYSVRKHGQTDRHEEGIVAFSNLSENAPKKALIAVLKQEPIAVPKQALTAVLQLAAFLK